MKGNSGSCREEEEALRGEIGIDANRFGGRGSGRWKKKAHGDSGSDKGMYSDLLLGGLDHTTCIAWSVLAVYIGTGTKSSLTTKVLNLPCVNNSLGCVYDCPLWTPALKVCSTPRSTLHSSPSDPGLWRNVLILAIKMMNGSLLMWGNLLSTGRSRSSCLY